MQRIGQAARRPPAISGRDPKGGLPRLSDVVAPILRCAASPRRARLAENHGKPSLWVFITDPWYYPRSARWLPPVAGDDSRMGIGPRIRPRTGTIGHSPLLIGRFGDDSPDRQSSHAVKARIGPGHQQRFGGDAFNDRLVAATRRQTTSTADRRNNRSKGSRFWP